MQITLTPEIENTLIEYANNQKIAPETLAINVLKEWFISHIITEPADDKKTLADYLANHIGVLSSSEYVPGGAQMSKNCGKKFAAGLLKKRQQGRL